MNTRLMGRDATWLGVSTLLTIGLLIPSNGFAQAKETTPDRRLQNAAEAFDDIMKVPEKGIPRDLLDKAECVVIVPGLKKGAFIVGAKYGRGFVSCRRPSERWGAPAGVKIEGGSYGLQLGGSSTDVFLLIMNESGMKKLLSDKFTIGGEAAAAAGPVGREASANTDVLLHAEILSWSRSRGLFAGLSLEGATLRPDLEENRKLYGRNLTNNQILGGDVTTPASARILISALNRYSGGPVEANKGATVEESLSKEGHATLGEVRFETAKSDITPDSESALNETLKALQNHPDWKIRVEGYTDNVGSKASNQTLSLERANAVRTWLAGHGIQRSRVTAKGFGQSHPVADNSTDDGRRKNRRVELVRM